MAPAQIEDVVERGRGRWVFVGWSVVDECVRGLGLEKTG